MSKFIFESVKLCREKNNVKFYIKKDLLMFNQGAYLSGNEVNVKIF